MDISVILNKIKNFYGFKKNSELAKLLDISPQTLSNWKTRNTYDPQLIYTKCVEISPEWLLSGKGPMLKNNYPEKEDNLNNVEDPKDIFLPEHTQKIPLYDLENNNELKDILEKNAKNTTVLNSIKIPNLTNCDGATYVKGNSMLPLFKSGDIIIFKKIPASDLFWGEIYLVEIALDDNSSFLTIKYLHKSELGKEFIKLSSENSAYEPKDLPINKINAIALIRASIRLH